MPKFDPNDLQHWTNGVWSKAPRVPVEGFCFDTRKLTKNACFLALKTENNDGHLYVKTARDCGASAAMVEHFIDDCDLPQLKVKNTLSAFQSIARAYRQTLPTKIITVTGSAGKTSAKELLSLLIGERTFKSHENLNNTLGVPFSLMQIDNSVHKIAVLEAGISEKDEMDTLASMLQPDVSILINVQPVHLEHFGTLEGIATEKAKLLNAAQERAYCPKEFSHLSKKVPTYVFSEDASEKFGNTILYCVTPTKSGWQCIVQSKTFDVPFSLGHRMAQTFAMMIGVALNEGISASDIQTRLLHWKPLPNRGSWQHIGDRRYFVDCYNANPSAFENSLEQFYREVPKDVPIVYCIGSMLELGTQSAASHRLLGKNFRIRKEDVFVCIGTFAENIKEGLLQHGAYTSQIYTFQSTEEARLWVEKLPHTYFYLKGSRKYQLENLIVRQV
jgi:UDP-N-acetylmuramoyl-tripeptide--D-alanyl-D-alanine ligase